MSEAQTKQSASLTRGVKVACRDIINREMRSNMVRVGELAKHPDVLRLTEHTHTTEGAHQQIGKVLTRAKYASEWSEGTYMVDTDL